MQAIARVMERRGRRDATGMLLAVSCANSARELVPGEHQQQTFIARGLAFVRLASAFAGSLLRRARLDDSVYRSFYRGRLGIFGSRASISDREQR